METKTREVDVRKRVKAALKKHGFHFHSAVAGPYSSVGIEDDSACIHGRYVAIESKMDATKKPTAMQSRNAASVIASGGVALLVHNGNVESFEKWVALCAVLVVNPPAPTADIVWPVRWL